MGQLILIAIFGALGIASAIGILAAVVVRFKTRNLYAVVCLSHLTAWLGLATFVFLNSPTKAVIRFAEIDRLLASTFFVALAAAAFSTFIVYLFSSQGPSTK